jgi:hypothetical protein
MHILLIERTIEHFEVSATTINVLFMFDGKLDNESLILIAKWSELPAESVKLCILGGLDT